MCAPSSNSYIHVGSPDWGELSQVEMTHLMEPSSRERQADNPCREVGTLRRRTLVLVLHREAAVQGVRFTDSWLGFAVGLGRACGGAPLSWSSTGKLPLK